MVNLTDKEALTMYRTQNITGVWEHLRNVENTCLWLVFFYNSLMFSNASVLCFITVLCACPENIHTPPQKGLEFPGGGGFSVTQKFKEMCEALCLYTVIQGCHGALYPSHRAAHDQT